MQNCARCGELGEHMEDNYGDPVCDGCWTLICDECGEIDETCEYLPDGTMICNDCYNDQYGEK